MIETMVGVFGGFGVGIFVGYLNSRTLNNIMDNTVSYYKETVDIWKGIAVDALAKAEFLEMQLSDLEASPKLLTEEGEETTWH